MPHTPRPWTLDGHRTVEAKCFTGELKTICSPVRGGNPEEADANACLIAAAPDLLAACKQLVDAPHQEHFIVRLNDEEMAGLDAIKTAIAKAEGRA